MKLLMEWLMEWLMELLMEWLMESWSIWVNYNDLTATSLTTIMVNKENDSAIPLIQLGEFV